MQNSELLTQSRIKLHYWNIRGVAQPIRHLLQYLHLQYEEVTCECPKKWYGNQIEQLKKKCAFISLPFIDDDGFLVSQTVAIAKYLCKKANRRDLLGKNVLDQARIQQLMFKIVRNRNKMSELWAKFTYENLSQQQINKNADLFCKLVFEEKNQISILKMIAKNTWAFSYLTIADFFLYETCFLLSGLFPDRITTNQKYINCFQSKFQSMEEIKKYIIAKPTLKIFMIPQLKKLWKGDKKFI